MISALPTLTMVFPYRPWCSHADDGVVVRTADICYRRNEGGSRTKTMILCTTHAIQWLVKLCLRVCVHACASVCTSSSPLSPDLCMLVCVFVCVCVCAHERLARYSHNEASQVQTKSRGTIAWNRSTQGGQALAAALHTHLQPVAHGIPTARNARRRPIDCTCINRPLLSVFSTCVCIRCVCRLHVCKPILPDFGTSVRTRCTCRSCVYEQTRLSVLQAPVNVFVNIWALHCQHFYFSMISMWDFRRIKI